LPFPDYLVDQRQRQQHGKQDKPNKVPPWRVGQLPGDPRAQPARKAYPYNQKKKEIEPNHTITNL